MNINEEIGMRFTKVFMTLPMKDSFGTLGNCSSIINMLSGVYKWLINKKLATPLEELDQSDKLELWEFAKEKTKPGLNRLAFCKSIIVIDFFKDKI